ncbi:MAG: aldehyde dehydrogenase family protein [Desulfobacterales bacterium]|nr:aldehyde dehydrogenase family protein [Desulfobacterales bacterium]
MTLRITNPYDRKVIAELAFDDATRRESKLRQAEEAFNRWRFTPLDERIDIIRQGLDYFHRQRELIAAEITAQMGKPIREAHNEFNGFFERAEHMLDTAPAVLAPDVLPVQPGLERIVRHEPLGVVFDIAAWNYPLLIAVNVVVPALAAGNTVVLKHSARTPLCGRHFEKAFDHYPGLVNHLVLDHADTVAVVQDPRVAHVVYTGSVEGGRRIQQAAAGRFIGVGLELGGKDPAYVAADADLSFAVPLIVEGACYNAGQSCCAVERVYVHRDCYPDFITHAQTAMRAFRPGDPADPSTTLGPLADQGAVVRLEGQVRDAVARGARLVMGGGRCEGDGQFFLPTLLADVPQTADVMQVESFGPVLPVQAVADDREALARMNASRYGLTASIWTRSRKRADWLAARLEAGTVYQNRCDYLDPGLPWSGVKDSGRGVSLSPYGYHHLTRTKSLHLRTSA